MFKQLRSKMVAMAKHRHGHYYLAFFSFIESIFFPVPVDVMLAPMVVANPSKARILCLSVVLASIVGGTITYSLSYYGFDYIVLPWLEASSYYTKYLELVDWFDIWGIWFFVVCSLSFVPYKLIAIVAGVVDISFATFFLISVTIRSLRFYLVTSIACYSSLAISKKKKSQ